MIDNGKLGGKLIGMLTSRDIDFVTGNRNLITAQEVIYYPITQLMTPFDQLVVGKSVTTLEQARQILARRKLPIVDEGMNLVSLLARADLVKNKNFPSASIDSRHQLMGFDKTLAVHQVLTQMTLEELNCLLHPKLMPSYLTPPKEIRAFNWIFLDDLN
ncbi:hypothetical protein MXB_3330 [Myxobolus squamalis]|nr:hypothetical protein MXB_3330 [Myxobolus squamalis]